MKKLLSAILLIALLLQALPLSALASSGHLLTEQELAAAIALTGIGSGGDAQSNAIYHKGMRPNGAWNAMQVVDWLDEMLDTYMFSVEEVLSRASVKLARLKESDSKGYSQFSDDNLKYQGMIEYVQNMYEEAEALREKMRWQQDRLTEQSALITELGQRYADGEDTMFTSDRVRLSFKIREAEAELKAARKDVVDNAEQWELMIQMMQTTLDPEYEGAGELDFPSANVGKWLSELSAYGEEAVENRAPVALVNASGSLLGRMSANGSVLTNDAKTEITVLTENQFAIQLYTGKLTDNNFIRGAKVTVLDLKKKNAEPVTLTTNNKGLAIFESNQFVADNDKNVTVKLDVEAENVGYRSFGISSVTMKLGQKRQEPLTPENGQPYVYSADFKGIDIFREDFDMLYSDMNDMEFEIHATIRDSQGNAPDLEFSYWKKGDGILPDYQQNWQRATSSKENTFTFRGTWKKTLSPFVSKSQLPFFAFGEDSDAERFPARIKSVKGAVSEPVDKGGKIFQDVLGDGFQVKCRIPLIEANAEFQLPIKKKLPKISIDPAGYVTVTLGSPIAEDFFKDKTNWKNKELKDYKEYMKDYEQKGFFKNYASQYNAALDYYTENRIGFMAESKLEFGWFVLASGRWLIDNQIEDVTHTTVSIRGAVGVTLKYSFSVTIKFAVGPAPFYACITIGVATGFSLSGEASFAYVNGSFKDWRLRFKDVVVNIGFTLTVQVGVGVKGFLDFWARFTGGINFRLLLVISGDEKSTFSGTASINFMVGLTFFMLTLSKEIYNRSGIKLFDDVPLSNALPPLQQYTVKSNAPEEVVPYSQEPLTYPELTQKVTMNAYVVDAWAGVNNAKVVTVGGQNYLFYIGSYKGQDKKAHRRVIWRNADNGNKGSVQELFDTHAPDEYRQLQDYAFDAYVAGDLVFLVVTAAMEFEDGLPKRNTKTTTNQFVYLTALAQVDGDSPSKANLTTRLPRGNYYNGSGLFEEHFFCCENPRVDATSVTDSMYYESVGNPRIDWVKVNRENGTSSGIEIYGTLGRIMYSEDEVPYGATGFRLISGQNGMIFHNDASVVSGMGNDYVRTLIRATTRSSTEKTPYGARVGRSFGFVALSKPKDGADGESAIELFEWEMNSNGSRNGPNQSIVLEKGYIDHFELIQKAADDSGSKARRLVLYTARENSPDGETRNRLYGLYIEPSERDGRDMTVTVTKYAYDLTLPTGKFSITVIGGTPYIYWMATAPTVSKESEGVYRVWAAALDLSSNSMTTPSVFCEFKPEQYKYEIGPAGKKTAYAVDIVPHTVFLTGTGRAYFTAAANTTNLPDGHKLFIPNLMAGSIVEQQKPVLQIETMIVEDATVAAGDFEDTTILLMNAGNMGITKFDLEFYTLNNGIAVVAETLHADLLHPENNSLTMAGASKAETMPQGKQAIYRNSDFDFTPRQRDWVLAHEKKAYQVYLGNDGPELKSTKIVDSETQHIATDVMMPGAMASFTGTLKIPENWSGKTTLYLRVKSASSNSLWGRAMANAAGVNTASSIQSNAAAFQELTWMLDEDSGKLVLQRDGVAPNSAVANAVKAGFIANETEVEEPVALQTMIHDIEIDHRLYVDGDGSDLLDIIVTNFADTKDTFKLNCQVILDGVGEPYNVGLYFREMALASRATHTITMPISALVPEPEAHSSAHVSITAIDRDENARANNEFTVYLGGSDPLHFIQQPDDVTVQEGEDVSFEVEVGGGVKPYTYQWQIWDEKHQKWVDIPGATGPALSRENIEKKWDGCRFRCVVTDAEGNQIISQEVTLTVRDKVPTGDNSNLPLYLAVALAALVMIALLRRRARRA